ncbi:MAG TPA: hypothetical protein VGU44_01360 [Gammaproteobacteria bacterium]|nr:hypothetical protein [Gammaproteobacteria bacterium]
MKKQSRKRGHATERLGLKKILSHKILSFLFAFCLTLVPFYYYCKYQTLKWMQETNFIVHAKSVYPTFHRFQPGLKLVDFEVKNKNPKASIKKITGKSMIIKPSLFSFMKLFSSYAFGVELNAVKINEQGELYGEIVKGSGEVAYSFGIYYLNNLIIEPFKFELTPKYSTLENNKLRKHSTRYEIHLVKLSGHYAYKSREFSLDLNVPRPISFEKNRKNYTIKAIGNGVFIREKLKESIRLPLKGNVKFNIEGFSNFLEDLHEAQLISSIANNIGAVLGYPITKQKLTSKKLEEIMTNAVSLNLRLSPKAAHIGVLRIYP